MHRLHTIVLCYCYWQVSVSILMSRGTTFYPMTEHLTCMELLGVFIADILNCYSEESMFMMASFHLEEVLPLHTLVLCQDVFHEKALLFLFL